MDNIAVFAWNGHLPSDDEVGADPATRYSGDYGEQWAYQACQPVAVAIINAIRQLGHQTDVETPYFGEHGWHFGVQLGQLDYSVMVQWVPHKSGRDYFAAEPSRNRGCLTSIFFPRVSDTSLLPIREVLNRALSSHPLMDDLEWVNNIDEVLV